MSRPILLLVDDDAAIVDTLSFFLARDFDMLTAGSRNQAVQLLHQAPKIPDLALVDLGLPPTPHRPDEGFRLITELLALNPRMHIFVLSGQSAEQHGRHARTLGAQDFLPKPIDPLALRQTLLDAQRFMSPVADGLIGDSLPMQQLREQIRQFSTLPFPVLIEGESGCGKELVAASLHRLHHAQQPMLALNCAAISPQLVEPTLFGYAKGAFTGANQAKTGYFEDAGSGTLFLDEIGDMPLDLQPKLLRVLENGEFQRVGDTQSRKAQARVIAATNRDLRQAVREHRFRKDLYHRLSVFTLQVPPLRELEQDCLTLFGHFAALYAQQQGVAPVQLDADAQLACLNYEFPGNVRELRNIVIRLTARYGGQVIDVKRLMNEFESSTAVLRTADEAMLPQALRELSQHRDFRLDATLHAWESAYIDAAMRLAQGNVSQAARLLGINRTTLYSRMELRDKDDTY